MRGILAKQDRKHAQHIDGIGITECPPSVRGALIDQPHLESTTGKSAEYVWRTSES